MIFKVRVSNWIWAKNLGFTNKKAGKDACPAHFGCSGCIHHALGAWVCGKSHALSTCQVFAML